MPLHFLLQPPGIISTDGRGFHPQDIVQRVGSEGPMGDFARALCAHLSPQLITVQHLAALLGVVQQSEEGDEGEGGPPDEAFLGAALRLLADSALSAPRMIASLEPQVLMQALAFVIVQLAFQ